MASKGKASQKDKGIETDKISDITLSEVLKSKVRLEIFFLLTVYRELSLTDLSKLANKSKPALHRHLQKLIDSGFVRESKEEKVRGSIKAKYYELVTDMIRQVQPINREMLRKTTDPEKRLELLKDLIKMDRSQYFFANASLDFLKRYTEQLEELIKDSPNDIDWESLIDTYQFQQSVFLFSKDTYQTYLESYEELANKVIKMEEDYETEHGEPPNMQHLVVLTYIPVQKLLELERKLPSVRERRFLRLFP